MSALGTPRQREAEARALAIFADLRVLAARARALAHFRADCNAGQPDQDELIRGSVDGHFFHAALMAVSETPRDPAFIWAVAPPHCWMGLDVPSSRFGQDNSDNCYRLAAVDPALCYRVTGHLPGGAWPIDFSLSATTGQLGENILANAGDVISIDRIDLDTDGRFAIDVDAGPPGGRNHLSIAGGKMLFARDTLGDWAHEIPAHLDIAVIGGATPTAFDPDAAAERAAALGETMCRFMLEALQHGIFERGPLNVLMPPWLAGANGGLATQASALGHYRLEPDEAMIVCAEGHGAHYVGMQITDIWMLSYDYWDRTSSLNAQQLRPDSDGKLRWVISARDPGVANWLDSGGHRHGTILLRWQHLPEGALPPPAEVSIVPVAEVLGHLPADVARMTAADRARQRQARRRDFDRRMVG